MKTLTLLSVALLVTACTPPPQNAPTDDAVISSPDASSFTYVSSAQSFTSRSSASATIQQPQRGPETTNEEWRKLLTTEQYTVLRESGTEYPYTSPLLDEKRSGTYVTADCGDPVFRSEQKFDSGTGWPSFWAPISPDAVMEKADTAHDMQRVEIVSKCGGHLGHVFTDGPDPTGLRYCINGLALRFVPDEGQ